MDAFFDTVTQLAPLSPESRQAMEQVLNTWEYPKGKLLVKPNTICNQFYFIVEGLSRTFYIKDGKDITDWISPEHTFAVSIISFITRQPDRRGIELLEASTLISMSFDNLEALCRAHHDVEHMTRLLVSAGMVQLQNKFDDLHFASALERYQTLMQTSPTIINRVPLGMIASYLGITQETLSRIRAQV